MKVKVLKYLRKIRTEAEIDLNLMEGPENDDELQYVIRSVALKYDIEDVFNTIMSRFYQLIIIEEKLRI